MQRPLATVVIGGLIAATLLTLFLPPTLYARVGRRELPAPPSGHVELPPSPRMRTNGAMMHNHGASVSLADQSANMLSASDLAGSFCAESNLGRVHLPRQSETKNSAWQQTDRGGKCRQPRHRG